MTTVIDRPRARFGDILRQAAAVVADAELAANLRERADSGAFMWSALSLVLYKQCSCLVPWEYHRHGPQGAMCPGFEARRYDGEIRDYGVVSRKKVTTAGVVYLANAFSGELSAEPELFKYHGFGIGTTAEANTQTALVTELTTEYAVNSTRPTGSQADGTSGADATYTTVATLSPDSGGTLAITEHGIFSATSSTTLWDRSVFAAVNVVASADSLQATYVLTIAAEA